MFSRTTKDKINGWGQVMRFITSSLIVIALWILGDMKNQIKDIGLETKEGFERINMQFDKVYLQSSNHLEHHRQFEIVLGERMATIETKINSWK